MVFQLCFISLLLLGSIENVRANDEIVSPDLTVSGSSDINSPFDVTTLSDGGWSSSGGGEFIINRNNPWFMGIEPVRWCLNYGGEKLFSLSMGESKNLVQQSLDQLSIQLKKINGRKIDTRNYIYNQGQRTCGVLGLQGDKVLCKEEINWNSTSTSIVAKYISDSFQFESDCSKADLEFILGNIHDPKIVSLRKHYGDARFFRHAGVAIRTKYDEKSKRGKGFIYIANDIGSPQYSGPRNAFIKKQFIWSMAKIPKSAKLLLKNSPQTDYLKRYQNYKSLSFHNSYDSPFKSVVTHELGHVFGFQHNKRGNIMDVDFTAKVIQEGVILKSDYHVKSKIFESSLFNLFQEPVYLIYRFKTKKYHKNKIYEQNKFLTGDVLIHDGKDHYEMVSDLLILKVDRGGLFLASGNYGGFGGLAAHRPPLVGGVQGGSIGHEMMFANIDKTQIAYSTVLSSPSLEIFDDKTSIKVSDQVLLRFDMATPTTDAQHYVFEQALNKWVQKKNSALSSQVSQVSKPLLNLWGTTIKGDFDQFNKDSFQFELRHDYFGENSSISFFDPNNEYGVFSIGLELIDIQTSSQRILPRPQF